MSAAKKIDELVQGTSSEKSVAEVVTEPVLTLVSDSVNPRYTQVPRAQILARETAICDLYVRLISGKMVKVAHKDSKVDPERINRFAEKNVESLYVLESDFSAVVRTLVKGVKQIAESPKATNDLVVEQYFQVAEAVLTEVVQLPVSNESLSRAAEVSQEIAERLQHTDDLSKGLRMIFTLGELFGRHTVGVVVMANWIGRQMGWSSARALYPVTMGALLHDIGKRELPPELMNKERINMSAEEIALYESHPTRGVMMLKGFDHLSSDILRIVHEHHEIPNGQGFPNNLRGERMFPLAKVVSLADVLAHEILDPLMAKRPLALDGVLDRMDTLYKSMYGAELVKAARKIFQKPSK